MSRATTPRRILMTVDALGGVWRYAMDAAQGLRERGIETLFVGLGPAPGAAQAREAASLGALHWLEAPLDWMVEDEAALEGVGDRLAAMAEAWGTTLLHLNLPTLAADLQTSLPVVAVSHSCVTTWFAAVHGTRPPAGWAWQVDRNRRGLRRADRVIAPSVSHAAALRTAYGELPDIAVVPNAVRPAAARIAKSPLVCAASRWWDDGKNAATLDAAAARIAWPVHAPGALNGPNGQRVRFHHAVANGPCEARAVRALMEDAAIFVSPSRYEPFGLAALEAAASRCALVLADIPTYREIWQDAALFVPAVDAGAYADALSRLIESPGLREDLAERAASRASRFTLAAQADALAACYATLCPVPA